MDYFFNETQEEIRELAYRIAVEKIKPLRAEYDENGTFPWDVAKVLADADLFGCYIPEEYGGLGEGLLSGIIVAEQMARICSGIALVFGGTLLGTYPIILYGNEEQKQKYLPKIARAESLSAFSITEAGSGSDATSIRTTAIPDGDHYVLNGTKQWVTNGGEAAIYTVVCITDKSRGARSATAFLIEDGAPGFSYGKKENKMGIRASATRELVFEDCRVHKNQVLGKPGHGIRLAMNTFNMTRPVVAAQAVGLAQGALDEALAYSLQREQFGNKIFNFQSIQNMLADMATSIESARLLLYHTCRLAEEGKVDVTKLSAMSKLLASDMCMKATVDAVQIFGGYGYMKEYPVEKMFRDAKITQIYEGTNQIQRLIIAKELQKEFNRNLKNV
ncbi:MAG: acyl-CoA dehydrogenase [candidate division Zixibacteria bacterium]|nr:acyl-CoA dehydrogenase [candidate division Zixibacteria bacterium]